MLIGRAYEYQFRNGELFAQYKIANAGNGMVMLVFKGKGRTAGLYYTNSRDDYWKYTRSVRAKFRPSSRIPVEYAECF